MAGCLERSNPVVSTRIEADLVVAAGSAAQEHAVWMKSGGSQGRAPVTLEEARVGLDARDFVSIEVKDLDEVCRCTTVQERSAEDRIETL